MKPAINFKNLKTPTSKIILLWVVIAIICVAVIGIYMVKANKTNTSDVKLQTAKVQKGDISTSVTGSGAVTPSSSYSITPNVNSKVKNIYFKDGDQVKAGDLIMELDDSDAQQSINQLDNNIAQSELTQNQNIKSLGTGTLTAPISGEISELQISNGDTAAKGAVLMKIVDKSKFKMTVSFNDNHRKSFKVGQSVTVNALDTTLDESYTLQGQVTVVGPASYTTAQGAEVYNVDVTVNNPGHLKDGMIANVEAAFGGVQAKSTDTATLQYISNTSIKTDAGGLVEDLYVANGQMVSKGAKLVKLNNDDLVVSKETEDLKLQSLNDQLAYQKEQLSEYKVYAPIDGTLTLTADIKSGDPVKSGTALGAVADYTKMSFDIPIDELDIAKVQAGQNVLVTVDALPETTAKPLAGTVTKVAVTGTSTNGVTTYPVTIQLEQTNRLKGGMNANAQIMISSKQNVLYVPIQAVQTRGGRSFVYVPGSNSQNNQAGSQTNGTQSQSGNNSRQRNNNSGQTGNAAGQNGNYTNRRSSGQNGSSGYAARLTPELQKYYANATMKPVEIGIHNDEFIEIVSGLNEGDTVILPPLATSSSTSQQTGNNAMGGVRLPIGGGNGGNSSFGGNTVRKAQ